MTTLDDLGFAHTRPRSTAKGKKTKGAAAARPRKNMQKEKYVFNRVSTKSAAYADYFNPDPEVERRLLGLSEMVRSFFRLFPPSHVIKPWFCLFRKLA